MVDILELLCFPLPCMILGSSIERYTEFHLSHNQLSEKAGNFTGVWPYAISVIRIVNSKGII